ncbi:unnamed protein product [Anisakis simplex]|uniref:Uncharacterized protein n=1 Tax=Anisakis simplex TaxID=6269 RepID=A0A0M3J9R5_ANISI|nr:unnamed protein product [Anisakis simplex]
MVRTKTTPTHSTVVKAAGTLNDAPSTYQDIPRNEPENGTVRNQRADAAASTDANERSLFVGRYCGAHSHPVSYILKYKSSAERECFRL